MEEACLSALMGTPGKQDIVSVISIKPRGESGEGLAALAERGLEAELAQAGRSGCHTCLGAVAVMYIKVKESYTLDTCARPCTHFTPCSDLVIYYAFDHMCTVLPSQTKLTRPDLECCKVLLLCVLTDQGSLDHVTSRTAVMK
jgi:hypothetical protein